MAQSRRLCSRIEAALHTYRGGSAHVVTTLVVVLRAPLTERTTKVVTTWEVPDVTTWEVPNEAKRLYTRKY
jgi:hypothetical protein